MLEQLESRQLLAAFVPHFDHIVVVVEENRPYSAIIGSKSAPFINKLVAGGTSFTRSFGITHPSQPNYLALFSGSTQGIDHDNCPVDLPGPSLGGELIAAGKTFAGYSEDLPETGSTVCVAGDYGRHHNPWSDFADVPAADNQPVTRFPKNPAKLPAVSFIIPNRLHNMHDGTIAAGDQWLKQRISRYATWAKTHNSLLIVTWDEDDRTAHNHIPTIFFGAHVKTGRSGQRINHFNVLRTIEDANAVPRLNKSADAASIKGVWS